MFLRKALAFFFNSFLWHLDLVLILLPFLRILQALSTSVTAPKAKIVRMATRKTNDFIILVNAPYVVSPCLSAGFEIKKLFDGCQN